MAKLIDMLVDAGLNKGFEWTDGFEYCAQDDDGDVLVFCNKKMVRTLWDGYSNGYHLMGMLLMMKSMRLFS